MIDIYLDKEDDNITASGTKHPRLCMVIQYNRKTLDLKKFTRFKVKILIGLQIGLGAFLVERSFFPENERNDQERPHPANKASPPDLAIRRRKCDGGGYIVPL